MSFLRYKKVLGRFVLISRQYTRAHRLIWAMISYGICLIDLIARY